MKKLYQTRSFWCFALILFLCFIGARFIAGEQPILSSCDGSLRFFKTDNSCETIIPTFVVKMDAETIVSGVENLLPPGTYTKEVGWHLLGTDALGRDVLAGILYGGQRSLFIGLVSGILAILIGWSMGLWTVFAAYFRPVFSYYLGGILLLSVVAFVLGSRYLLLIPIGMLLLFLIRKSKFLRRSSPGSGWWWSRGMEWYQALPDLLILMLLSASLRVENIGTLTFIIIAVIWPSIAILARRVGSEVTGNEYFQQALRNKVGKKDLLFHYLWGNTRSYVFGLLPLVIARIILLESTLSFLGLGLPPDVVTIGSVLSGARNNIEAWWLILSGSLFIFWMVYPLMNLSRVLLEDEK